MLLTDMFDRVMTDSGQFLVDPENLEIDLKRFSRLVKNVLGTYNRHSPIVRKFNFRTGNVERIDFTPDFTNPITGEVLGIPEWISSAVPVRGRSNLSPFFQGGANGRLPGSAYYMGTVDLVDKDPTPYEYRKPRLYLPYPGLFDIKANYHHVLVGTDASTYEVRTIHEKDDIFFELLLAKFLIALGRNRRAFTLQPLELTSDSESMVSEGNDLWEKAKQNLVENFSSFADAWD